MSAKDALSETVSNVNFDSPNISSSEEIEVEQKQDEMTEEQRLQKQRETVQLDGIPIDEKNIQFRASDIKNKSQMNFFVNIEDNNGRSRGAKVAPVAEQAPQNAEVAAVAQTPVQANATNGKAVKDAGAAKTAKRQSISKKILGDKANSINLGPAFAKYRGLIIGVVVSIIVFVVVAMLSSLATTAIISSINSGSSTGGDGGNSSGDSYSNDPYKAAVVELGVNQEIADAFKNKNFESIDDFYSNYESKITNTENAGHLYMDKAIRLLRYAPEEKDRIIEAAEKGATLAFEDPDIYNDLAYIYKYFNENEKAQKAITEMERLRTENAAEKPSEEDQ